MRFATTDQDTQFLTPVTQAADWFYISPALDEDQIDMIALGAAATLLAAYVILKRIGLQRIVPRILHQKISRLHQRSAAADAGKEAEVEPGT